MTCIQRTAVALSSAALVTLVTGLLTITTEPVLADTVKLTGCLVKGEGDGAGYMLVNAPMTPASIQAQNRSTTPGTVGTAGAFANIFYWLEKDDSLAPHIGHKVEIDGDVEGDIKEGEIKIDRKDQWTEIEIKSDGREMKAQVPNASVVAGPDADRKIDVLVRRLDVENVRMIDAACR